MSARDKIAEIIMANRAVDNWQGPTPADVDLANAILAAMPDMIAPLVWTKTKAKLIRRTNMSLGLQYTMRISLSGSAMWRVNTVANWSAAGCADIAIRAVNTHHRAAIMAAFNGEAN
jgi:hypothetical protein